MTRFPDGPADSPGFLLWHLTLHWQRTITAALAHLDLTHVQFVLLACTYWLTTRGETPNQLAVASQAGTNIKMTSQVLRRLEERGFIERHVDTRDTRAKVLTVTRQGKALARKAIERVEAADDDFFRSYPPALAAALREAGLSPGPNGRTGGATGRRLAPVAHR